MVDDLLDGGGQQVRAGAGLKVAVGDAMLCGLVDVGEAFHQAAHGFGDAIL
ncbi:MAG TPA: hypothetical protein VH589_29545 [Trebonia sp.]